MKRPDFNKFVKNVKNIMPEGYQIYNIESDKDNDNLLARIISGRTIDFSAKYLDKYHGFPYVAGIDISAGFYCTGQGRRRLFMYCYRYCQYSSQVYENERFRE